METPELDLRGPVPRWGRSASAFLVLCVALGLWLRLRGLAAEGFGDDEVHVWLAAQRYLRGDFTGDHVEHPMLLKLLIAFASVTLGRFGFSPESLTRLPNALLGGASIVMVAFLGRRLFGRTAALIAAALTTVAVTFVGYQRVAKEDVPLGLFLMLLLYCLAEAKAAADDERAADQDKWELRSSVALAFLFASKYFFWHALTPVVFAFWVRGTGSRWRMPLRRWLQLIGLAFALWVCINWTPFLPATWEYAKTYITGQQTVHGSLFFMGRIYHNLTEYGWNGTPPWFYLVFPAVKFTPLMLLAGCAGLVVALRQRRASHRLVLSWMGVWYFVHSLSGSKWGRFFITVTPAFFLLAGHASALLLAWAQRRPGGLGEAADRPGAAPVGLGGQRGAAFALAAAGVLFLVGGEAAATVSHAPHQRLYISPLGGGDSRIAWFFPHCDYFDAGFREAMQTIAARAEPGAEVSTEIDWPTIHYAQQSGRPDLVQTMMRRGKACQQGRICYVVVQTGRWYFLNQDAVRALQKRTPWDVVRIRGEDVVKIYRLLPGESPYPEVPAQPLANGN